MNTELKYQTSLRKFKLQYVKRFERSIVRVDGLMKRRAGGRMEGREMYIKQNTR
jgi:hypothetical protein